MIIRHRPILLDWQHYCCSIARVPPIEIILRDFDGTRTVYKTEPPLRNLIATAQSEMQVTIHKTYVKTEERDERGRIIYAERK